MASTIKHTIEISNNNHTPSKPSQTNRPNPSGATSQTYQTQPLKANPKATLKNQNHKIQEEKLSSTPASKTATTRRADKRKHYPPTPTKIKPTPRDRNHTQK
ncbi:hypothetical protein [Timonella sp. A28]|uniref:hypothetical protein n=1 Tax=Timonella sp. A28 TaxID=3442640 RepID=UPI003EB7E934